MVVVVAVVVVMVEFFSVLISCGLSQPAPPDENVESSTDLFDGSSVMFRMALASLCGMLGLAIIAGITYHNLIFVPHQKRGKTSYLLS